LAARLDQPDVSAVADAAAAVADPAAVIDAESLDSSESESEETDIVVDSWEFFNAIERPAPAAAAAAAAATGNVIGLIEAAAEADVERWGQMDCEDGHFPQVYEYGDGFCHTEREVEAAAAAEAEIETDERMSEVVGITMPVAKLAAPTITVGGRTRVFWESTSSHSSHSEWHLQ
jgi:hypothetical protein